MGNSGLDLVPKKGIIKMDNRNVFVAIALSMAVLLFWGAFFETPRQVKEGQNNEQVVQQETLKMKLLQIYLQEKISN